jgi:carboxypeptidase D
MYQGKPCPSFIRETFPDGITNGADWYPVTGGMQDYSYLHGGTYELTLEVGCYKFPRATELSKYWMDNRESLIKYIEQVHIGIKGYVKSSIGTPIPHAVISVNNIQHVTYTGKLGDFYRLLLPGKYNITASAKGYETQTDEIVIPDTGSHSLIHTFNLMRNDPQHWSSAYDFRILENIIHTKYHSNSELEIAFRELQRKNPLITLYEDDANSQQYYTSLKVTDSIGESEETKLHIMVLSSVFETSPLGREMIANLARHVVTAYNTKEPLMIELLKNVVIHFVIVNENFDSVYEQFYRNVSICDPHLNEELGDKFLSAESDEIKNAFFKLFEKDEISLALTFTAGDDSNVQVLKDREPIYSQFIRETQLHLGAQNQICSSNTRRLNENESLRKITNLLYSMFNLPLYSINLSCCKMPSESDIADVWRENIDRILKFINLGRTGVVGYVKDRNHNPLRNARVRILGSTREYRVSKNLAHFHALVPNGGSRLEISCENFTTKVVDVLYNEKTVVNLKDIVLEVGTSIKQKGNSYDIKGYVVDETGRPIEKAEIGIKGNWRKQEYTNSVGQFVMTGIDNENPVVTVKKHGFKESEKLIAIKVDGTSKDIIFKLAPSDDDMGLSNLLFIFFICTLILISVVCITCCAVSGCNIECPLFGKCFGNDPRRHLMENYKFSLLSRRTRKDELFPDETYGADSEEEEELFNPIKLRGN